MDAVELEIAPDSVVEEVTKAPVGFAGPVNDFSIRTVFDISIKNIKNAITGANEKDKHFTGVNPGRDFEIKEESDLSTAVEGDLCPKCSSELSANKHRNEKIIYIVLIISFGIAAPIQLYSSWTGNKELMPVAITVITTGVVIILFLFLRIPKEWNRWK